MWLVIAVATIVVGASAAARLGLSAPLLLVVIGVLASLLPFVPEYELNPELVLVGILPPLLFTAAYNTSFVDFKARKGTIASLSVGLVVFTAVGVGLVVWQLLPDLPLAGALALGAVIAPPDAVAATAIAKRVGMPKAIVRVLEGESLVNDATALTTLRAAQLALAGSATVLAVGLDFLVAAGGGVLVGIIVAEVYSPIRARVTNPVVGTPVSFLVPYVAFLIGEEVHASGVVAVVVAGLMVGHRSPLLHSGSVRLTAENNWRAVSFLLENGVFLLIGLQLPSILDGVRLSSLGASTIAVACVGAFLATVITRFVWVFGGGALARVPLPARSRAPAPDWRELTVISWAGMRGVVTLAAAFLLPMELPHRSVLLLIAFVVVVATLLVEGLTLPGLVRRLGLPAPDRGEELLAEAALVDRVAAAGLQRLDEVVSPMDSADVLERLRQRAQNRRNAAWEQISQGVDNGRPEAPTAAFIRLRLAMMVAERQEVLAARDEGLYDDDVVRSVIRDLDVEESRLEVAQAEAAPRGADLVAPQEMTDQCRHLRAAPPRPPSTDLTCQGCLVEGTEWVHLRMCLACGYRGCCDSSVAGHARRHFEQAGHPVMRSLEPGEAWRWCYVDEVLG
ncbi:MAG: monovalent cation/hydrogen antiporter [Actinomycetota bacterium]|nr:monovalent cation/hydrogen antiporter [Actinomycetota bacterium]